MYVTLLLYKLINYKKSLNFLLLLNEDIQNVSKKFKFFFSPEFSLIKIIQFYIRTGKTLFCGFKKFSAIIAKYIFIFLSKAPQ